MANELSMSIDGREWQAAVRSSAAGARSKANPVDAELIERCRAGDQSAYQALVQRYQKKAFWIAYEMINDKEEALDLVQEAFVRVFRSIDRFDTSKSFYTWLYRIVTNLCIDALRKGSKGRPVSLEGVGDTIPKGKSPRESLEKRELGEQIRSILDVLPKKYKTMITLRDIEGHSCLDIADVLGCSHANVRWRLHKARKMFKELWERRFGESEKGTIAR